MTIYSHQEQVAIIEKLQRSTRSLKLENSVLLENSNYLTNKIVDLQGQLKTIIAQRDQFIQLAKNLDSDFNQGSIFSKSNL